MKRLFLVLIAVTALCVTAFAYADCLISAEMKSEVKTGERIELTMDYELPHDNTDKALLTVEATALDSLKIESARTLVCDDVTCNMYNNADFLEFDGKTVTLYGGYSGSITFSAVVLNAEKVNVKFRLAYNGTEESITKSATVTDYVANTPTPKPSETPKATGNSKSNEQSNNTENVSVAPNGSKSCVLPALLLVMVGVVVSAMRYEKRESNR